MLKQNAENWKLEESMMLARNDPSAVAHDGTSVAHEGIVVTHDGIVNPAPAIDASVLSNESNTFYSNFCVDLADKLQAVVVAFQRRA